ncbi:nucleic acid binding protein [Trifolium pratense]|uniref:Nucleic acid binding protein n=1 Tax=Trifolium pratense TaxID=57577 RepID=A0A2K3NK09_TRIPR|nr:nucleic acid binding protein [Trifolium pratense]
MGSNQKHPNLQTNRSFRDVVHGNTRVVHRSDNSSPESSILGQETSLLKRKPVTASSSSSSTRSASCSGKSSNGGRNYTTSSSSSSRGMQFRKLSGCYECHMIVDPSRLPIPRSTVCACDQCGEVFPKIESLELHQAVRHAVLKASMLRNLNKGGIKDHHIRA